MNKKILILTPDLRLVGGVSNHYLGLRPHWTSEIKYLTYGKRLSFPAFIVFPIDLFFLLWQLCWWRPDVIIVNPSLRYYQLIRDGVYLLFAYLFRVKAITFFHGWDYSVADKLKKKSRLFTEIYGRSEFVYVLCKDFAKQLKEIGIQCPVLLTTTKFDEKLIKGFDIRNRKGEVKNLLFLARVEENKGIFIALDIFSDLSKKYPDICFTVVGSGRALKDAKDLVKKRNLKNVHFKGSLIGSELFSEFRNGDLYLLPSFGEGMPTTVLEAMAVGLPIVTRPLGGLNDFFKDGEMGYLISSLEPKFYVEKIENLINNKDLVERISNFNYKYAIENFIASKVAEKIEKDMQMHIN